MYAIYLLNTSDWYPVKIQEKIMGFLNMMLYIFFLQCPPFDMIFKLLLISSDDFQYESEMSQSLKDWQNP